MKVTASLAMLYIVFLQRYNMTKNVLNYEEALKNAKDYFQGDDLASSVFISKYATTENDMYLESTPKDMHMRMAKEYARIEEKMGGENKLSVDEIFKLFNDWTVIPGGSVMNGLGNPSYIGSLSNCFVAPPPQDSYSSIMNNRETLVQLMKRRGGVGIDISFLRPSGAKVNNAAKSSTGAVSFMNVYSELTKEVALNGRRGALMISMSGKHPDIDEFIRVKQDLTKITGANVSVKFDDEFMNAVINDDYYIQRFPIDLDINSIDKDTLPLNQKVFDGVKCYKKVKAKEIWNEFALCSWRTAEPGIMYEDKHLNYSPDSVYEEYKGITTNPCGEIFMDPNNSCRLMHINFANFVENPFTENAYFDYDKLAKYAGYNMRLCDDLVELELEYVTKIIEKIKSTYTDENQAELKLWETIRDKGEKSRRAGCGGTGLADAIAMLNLKFGSKESLDVINKIFHAKMWGELQMQTILAKERGTFFGFDFKKEFIENNNGYTGTNEFFTFIAKEFPEEIENIKNYGRRNVSWSTMAPVGSVSLLTQTTSGIEPLFSAFYKRRKKVSSPNDRVDFIDNTGEKFTEYFVIHKPFEIWIKNHSELYTNEQDADLNSLTEETLTELFNKSPWGGASASELTPLQHIETQTIAQKYTTHSISKTINLPETATVDEVSQLYIDGWKQNLKGVTIYRDNCRAGVMVKSDSKCECKTTLTHNAPKRPKTMKCDIKRFKNGGEKWIAAIGLMDGKPYEIFTGLAEKLNIPEYVTEAEIIKNKINKLVEDEDTGEMIEKKVSRYDIRYVDTNGKKITIEGLSTIFNPVFYNYSKLISGLLRHGMGVQYIISTIKSMDFKDNNINSWKNGVIRSLKQYLEDGEIKGESCPSCGGKISRINGCKTCTNCGWSACS